MLNIQSDDLKKALDRISVIASKDLIIPVIGGVKITAKGKKVRFQATNLEIEFSIDCEADVDKGFEAVADAGLLHGLVKTLSSQLLTFKLEETSLAVETDKGLFTIPGYDPDDFPSPRKIKENQAFKVEGSFLIDLIEKVGYIKTQDGDLKPALDSIFFEYNDKLRATCTDTHLLASYTCEVASGSKGAFLIKRQASTVVRRLLSGSQYEVLADDSAVRFRAEDHEITVIQVNAKYPNWRSVVPEDENWLSLQSRPFLQAIKRLDLFSDETTRQCVLDFNEKGFEMQVDDAGRNTKGNESVLCDHQTPDLKIGLNLKLLMSVIEKQGPEIWMSYSQPNRAVVFKEDKSEDQFTLQMPVMLNYG